MPTTEEMLTTIDAKLSALLKVVVDSQAGTRPPGAAPPPIDLETRAASLSALLDTGTQNGAAAGPPAPAPAAAPSAEALDEIAKLLALSLLRKRNLEDVIVQLDAAGFERWRIAELLGTKLGRVDGAIDRAARKR